MVGNPIKNEGFYYINKDFNEIKPVPDQIEAGSNILPDHEKNYVTAVVFGINYCQITFIEVDMFNIHFRGMKWEFGI